MIKSQVLLSQQSYIPPVTFGRYWFRLPSYHQYIFHSYINLLFLFCQTTKLKAPELRSDFGTYHEPLLHSPPLIGPPPAPTSNGRPLRARFSSYGARISPLFLLLNATTAPSLPPPFVRRAWATLFVKGRWPGSNIVRNTDHRWQRSSSTNEKARKVDVGDWI
jgi:hypothetical protein